MDMYICYIIVWTWTKIWKDAHQDFNIGDSVEEGIMRCKSPTKKGKWFVNINIYIIIYVNAHVFLHV